MFFYQKCRFLASLNLDEEVGIGTGEKLIV
jgi:hypothetical protein